jgi:hypothetical protein
MYNIPYLILGLIAAAGIPLGILWIAIKYADKIDKQNKK